jgi:hypothetical protein
VNGFQLLDLGERKNSLRIKKRCAGFNRQSSSDFAYSGFCAKVAEESKSSEVPKLETNLVRRSKQEDTCQMILVFNDLVLRMIVGIMH